jgi:integrase
MSFKPRNSVGNQWVNAPKSYDWLLEHDIIKTYVSGYSKEKMKKDVLWALNRFFKDAKINPKEFVELDPRSAKQLIGRVINPLKAEGKNAFARTIRTIVKNLYNSSNEYNGNIPISFDARRDRIPKIRKKIHVEHIPTKPEIHKMVDYWNEKVKRTATLRSIRNRAMILTQVEAGLRPGALCNLKVGMVRGHLFPDVKLPIPLKITVDIDAKLSLYSLDYYMTFIWTQECASYLRELIEYREKHGEKLVDKDYLFTPSREAISKNPNIQVKDYNLNTVKYTAEMIGLDPNTVWAHLLRKTYRKILNSARAPKEGMKELDEDTKEAVFGHRLPGSRENYFDRIDLKEVVEKMRNCDFSRSEQDTTAILINQTFKEQIANRDSRILELESRLAKLEILYTKKLDVKRE